MLIVPHGVRLSDATAATTMLALAAFAAAVTGSLVVSKVRDELRDAERQLYLYTWHLREFVPQTARPSTDPTGGRRSRARPATE